MTSVGAPSFYFLDTLREWQRLCCFGGVVRSGEGLGMIHSPHCDSLLGDGLRGGGDC
jgi:hypothetical protein